ncbi:NifB/NifX family molybdenum-iron cluster-binding protein [uncultured Desulfuromusa sp.]|uniref:NifB/NifX family molybdenum-iron cluster-binding protein n=1 Tax=uncultured Desulfuromusa sp. TaxID=219183 RepID=UPI002AA92995|nr:NifB/NifX family molybdenum-iron cluster-binding protein [uncultured Desulfuromusa sp.]
MQKIRVCIGSNDGETIAQTHMGDTKFFYLYDLVLSQGYAFVEKRSNVARDMEHDGADKMKAIIALVADVDVFVARKKSPNFIKIAKQTRYQPVVVTNDDIQDVLALLQGDFVQLNSYVERRRRGEFFEFIPVIS